MATASGKKRLLITIEIEIPKNRRMHSASLDPWVEEAGRAAVDSLAVHIPYIRDAAVQVGSDYYENRITSASIIPKRRKIKIVKRPKP